MNRINITNKNKIYLLIVFALFISIGVGYAFLSSSLSINGDVKVKAHQKSPDEGSGGDGSEVEKDVVCKRATTLHTETCNNSSCYPYSTGNKIPYGNVGTTGPLTSGDAFDCDVNGDGTYDSTTERFYYVSDLDTDSNYAVLIYYNNVSAGEPNNTAIYAYAYTDDVNTASDIVTYAGPPVSDVSYYGPQTAMLQLPITSQWKRVNLSSSTRNITEGDGTIRVEGFSYEGYSSRLLTVQELESACGITVGIFKTGDLDSCQYLLENTRYSNSSLPDGYWLETLYTDSNASVARAYRVDGDNRSLNADFINDELGSVRPAIEVLKTSINY